MNNRPLPEPPRSEAGGSSRSGTPKSVFDGIQRPPSVQLEKIKSKASATLDRMAILQQRYRQQKARQELSANSEQVSGGPPTPHIAIKCIPSSSIVSFRLCFVSFRFVSFLPLLALYLSLWVPPCFRGHSPAAASAEWSRLRALVNHLTIAIAFSFRQHVIRSELIPFRSLG